jgi:hypothetical protein
MSVRFFGDLLFQEQQAVTRVRQRAASWLPTSQDYSLWRDTDSPVLLYIVCVLCCLQVLTMHFKMALLYC